MLKIKIICPGTTKEKALQILETKYQKLLSPYAQIEWSFTKESRQKKNQSLEQVRGEEGIELLKKIPSEAYVIVLDEHGQQIESREFAGLLKENEDLGRQTAFVIGGTFGLCDDVKKRADRLLSLSKMTFTHEMARSLLLEQIYRGICIKKGKKYHY